MRQYPQNLSSALQILIVQESGLPHVTGSVKVVSNDPTAILSVGIGNIDFGNPNALSKMAEQRKLLMEGKKPTVSLSVQSARPVDKEKGIIVTIRPESTFLSAELEIQNETAETLNSKLSASPQNTISLNSGS